MKGDREECLRAGMDGYLSKPIRPEHLDQAIAEVTRAGQVGGTAGLSGPHPPTLVDPKSLRDRLGDDPTLLREMAGLFQADAPRLLEQVRVAVARGDAPGLFRAAHTLKGAVSTFALDESFQAAERLEAMGRTGDLAAAGPAYHHLTEALARFQATLREWLAAQT